MNKIRENKITSCLTFLDIELVHVQRNLRSGFAEQALKSAENAKKLIESVIENLEPVSSVLPTLPTAEA